MKTNIIKTKCACGEPISIELMADKSRTCRKDLKRPFYPDDDYQNATTVFRCRQCRKPITETVPEAELS